jgi:hypothetical protein
LAASQYRAARPLILVRQEFYGWVLARYAVRWLMYSAATEHKETPRKLSFVANVQLFATSATPSLYLAHKRLSSTVAYVQ